MDFHIVDDNTDILDLLAAILVGSGFDVATFSSPLAYLEYLKSHDLPKAVITDIRMPCMSGLDLIGTIREKHPDQKFVIMTGYADESLTAVRTCFKLLKPIFPDDLLSIANIICSCDDRSLKAPCGNCPYK